jgi:SurA-like protein
MYHSKILVRAMLKIILITVILFSNVCLASASKILAVVDSSVISSVDVDNRLKVLEIYNNKLPEKAELDTVRRQILEEMVVERLYLMEAHVLGVSVNDKEVQSHIKAIAEQKNKSYPDFVKLLKKNGEGAYKSALMQIKSQVAWMKLVNLVLRNQIKVSEQEVIEALKAKGEDVMVTIRHFLIDKEQGDKEVEQKKRINKFRAQIKNCANLNSLAKKYEVSKPDSISTHLVSLSPEIRNIISQLNKYQPSKWIEAGDGKHLQMLILCNTSKVGLSQEEKLHMHHQLIEQKLNQKAVQYIKNLKQKTFIEYK